MTKSIAETAAILAERLDIPTPKGDSSPEFRLSFARTLRIRSLKEQLLRQATKGLLRPRYPDGGYLPEGGEITESSHVDIAEAQSALLANGEKFVDEVKVPASSSALTQSVEKVEMTESPQTENWKLKVQAEATRRWIALVRGGASPTKLSIRDDLVRWCADEKIKTKTGIAVSAENLYKFALRPWKPPNCH